MSQILTLIAPPGGLAAPDLARTREALAALGASAGTPDWLAPAEAADLPFAELAPDQAIAAARAALGEAPIDLIAQPAEGRRKALLLADMDSTIVTSETLDEIAAYAGLKERIAEITRRSMNGELDFRQALIERVGMLEGLSAEALERTWEATEMTPGAGALVATMRAHGAHCAIVSGGFTFFTGRVADRLGFHAHYSNTLLVADGKLTGKVGEPILDRDAKLATLKRLAAELSLPLTATLTVGDGANDLAMLQAAGLGVAFRAKPVVAAAARARVDHADLRALLFAQGYRAAEISAA
ncbi:phosphoserine phosphatase SerB [Siccirubricoccus deserti]|uniref:Phosphoserine phosphatase n=1 Tax=Siccirubricoccus deserti TaxID=2013562 RepID=A0A9X0UEI1_9PROT|nr:phosphoserine phosphatase SerB [Siccirubricoccus deserti]MBC4017652.1 phosphoserine phosphatase SerB [Siccirubricoccus deserti]GGC55400.1 phosphoserine phosphatase SerB [Siccirubricoccus deserti]